eukprot:TRINITY_DN18200_c0_g2_i3.p1 TRINITY_DN18200_c0_g2~~TRINITY_DN18200_c0_g2_i3.p1  ORF type:complete len:680 (+),score=125.16 TRINITY_DN18200_c0_g2_i3:525-2564(+)
MEWNVNNAFKTMKEMEPKSMMDMAMIPNIESHPIDIRLESSDKGNAVSSMKPRKKSMTSLYLKFFETAPDGKSRRCKFCQQSYSISTATGNLGRHLNNRHPGYNRQQGDASTPVPQPVSIAKKAPPAAKAVSVDFDRLNWLLLKCFIGGSLPLSAFEDEGLANSFKFLNSSAKFWSREKLQTVILEVFRTMQEDLRASIEQVQSMISITLDFWTSYEQISYLSITGHWIDENWSPCKVLLDISHIPFPCGSAEIYHTLLKVLKMFNIDNGILCCTHDNSQRAIHACHTLKEDLDSRKLNDLQFFFIPCAARTLNLIIDDGLKTMKPMISRIREFALQMNASSEIAQDFWKVAEAYQEGSWKIPLDASTRWSGEYTMLDIVRKAHSAIENVVNKHGGTLTRSMLLNTTEKNLMNMMHAYLEPFHKTTNNLCTSKSPTVGLVLFFMDHVIEMINACRDSHGNPDWLKSTADEMSKKARSYSSQINNLCIYISAILDPRIKGEYLPENLNSENYTEAARSRFVRRYSFPAISNCFTSAQDDEGSSVSFAEEIARKKRRGSMSSATDELTQYLSEPPAPIAADAFDWWKGNCTRYPRLSVMARDFLAVQATSVAPDELFSSKGDEVDKQRICLPHSYVQPVLCIRSWNKSGYKLKFRAAEIDYEKLMEFDLAADNATKVLSVT